MRVRVTVTVRVRVRVRVTGEPAVVSEVQIAQRLGQWERLAALKRVVATWTQLLGQHVSEEDVKFMFLAQDFRRIGRHTTTSLR